MLIRLDDLAGPEIRSLLEEHLGSMHELSPPESVHALDLSALGRPEIAFWTAWSEGDLLGCGALKELDAGHGEIKSMRTAAPHRGKGVGRAMLEHLIAEARRRSYARLSLETGSVQAFVPARRLYESFGFSYCGPFADYTEDPNSVFMTRPLQDRQSCGNQSSASSNGVPWRSCSDCWWRLLTPTGRQTTAAVIPKPLLRATA